MAAMRETFHFLGQLATRFRQTGAVLPSSRRLARAMVNAIGPLQPGELVVELGPGTGVFTRELARCFPANAIVAVEFNRAFADRLRQRMPLVQVVEGCASRLTEHLDGLAIPHHRVGAVISGLPLLSLPQQLSECIFAAITTVLSPGRRYVQFTYSKRAWRRFDLPGFRLEKSKSVWLNLPPAVVLPFTRLANGEAAR
jgi:phosphatidylethanolamine/phosphatidyl-N-methylethanolamine N-methyltransferase